MEKEEDQVYSQGTDVSAFAAKVLSSERDCICRRVWYL